jgi:CRISPR-associated protein Cas2
MSKKDNYNYGYIFLFYDIKEERVNKVFKICKKYLTHFQNSVFRGEISPGNLIKLKNELENIVEDEDFITIIKFFNNKNFEEDTIGIGKENGETLIL